MVLSFYQALSSFLQKVEVYVLSRLFEQPKYLPEILIWKKSDLNQTKNALKKTLEYLETQGVPIVGYKTNSFPLFYTDTSPYDLQQRENNAEDIANLAMIHWDLGLKGMIVANPIPFDDSLNPKEISFFIDQAIEEINKNDISGKSVTPFLLKRVSELSKGKTLKANKSLLVNNASVAGKIAVALQEKLNSTSR